MSRRGRDVIKSESIPPPGWSPTNRWTKTATDALPKEQGVRASYKAHKPRGPTPGRRVLRTDGFKGKQDVFKRA